MIGRFIGQLALAWSLAITGAAADTIHLKNGRTIVADTVRENGNHYEYDIGDDSYAIPKSSVDHVDAGGMPAHSASGSAKVGDLPAFTPADSLANEGDLVTKIVKEGKVNPEVLAGLEAKGNPELSATADFIAGKFEFEHGNIAQAHQYFESALRFQPDNSTILIYYSALLVRTGNAAQALPYAERAVKSAPSSHRITPRMLSPAGNVLSSYAPILPFSSSWRKPSANRPSSLISLRARAVISFYIMRANRLPRPFADRSSPR